MRPTVLNASWYVLHDRTTRRAVIGNERFGCCAFRCASARSAAVYSGLCDHIGIVPCYSSGQPITEQWPVCADALGSQCDLPTEHTVDDCDRRSALDIGVRYYDPAQDLSAASEGAAAGDDDEMHGGLPPAMLTIGTRTLESHDTQKRKFSENGFGSNGLQATSTSTTTEESLPIVVVLAGMQPDGRLETSGMKSNHGCAEADAELLDSCADGTNETQGLSIRGCGRARRACCNLTPRAGDGVRRQDSCPSWNNAQNRPARRR
jgi:hypothetical protein